MVFRYVFRVGFFQIAYCLFIQDYQLNCPSFPQWKIRGSGLCKNSSIYTCLHNTNEDKNIEDCGFDLNVLEPGYRFVISGMLDSRPCGPERFQPFSLLPNTSSRCVIHKSQCSREGQVVYRNGTTTGDRSCRCNYIDNFVFVTKPKTKCYCIPSEEDCSCYNKACDVDHYLTPDYQCVHFSNWTGIFQCPPIQNEKIPTNGAPTRQICITKSVPDSTGSTSSRNIHPKHIVSVVLGIFLCVVFFLCGMYFEPEISKDEQEENMVYLTTNDEDDIFLCVTYDNSDGISADAGDEDEENVEEVNIVQPEESVAYLPSVMSAAIQDIPGVQTSTYACSTRISEG